MRGLLSLGFVAFSIASSTYSFAADDASRAERFRLLALDGRSAVRWTLPQQGRLPARITYAFVTAASSFPGARNCDTMLPAEAALDRSGIATADFRREVRAAFTAWEGAVNVAFEETASVAEAGILIGADGKARGRAFTNVALMSHDTRGHAQPGGIGAIRQSLICLNPSQPWKIGFDGNLKVYDLRYTMTHEIGHAIGLDHPGPEGQLMSFRYDERSRDLQPGDIEGAALLYGRRGTRPTASGALTGTTLRGLDRAQAEGSLGLSEAAPR